MMLGVHCSVAGGLHNAFLEAAELGIDTFQVFTRNQRQWKAKPIAEEEAEVFGSSWDEREIKTVFSHASYLINLASPKAELRKKSRLAITAELERCEELGLAFTVLHPGSTTGIPEVEGIENIASELKLVLEATENYKVKILLENTAGQGTNLGYDFQHIRDIMDLVKSDRIGTCFDTCHAFAAGYDIRTEKGFERTMNELDRIIGLDNLHAIHLNDSKTKLGSRVDRHEHIGKGEIGRVPFRAIMKRFQHIPKVLETPKEGDMDMVNLQLLRKLAVE